MRFAAWANHFAVKFSTEYSELVVLRRPVPKADKMSLAEGCRNNLQD